MKYAILSKEEFLEKLLAAVKSVVFNDEEPTSLNEINLHDLSECIEGKGLEEIEHDWENIECVSGFFNCKLVGIQTVGDLTFLGITAGGDWETPIFFITYFDENLVLRAYIPKKGNLFNSISKSAFGNSDSDERAAQADYGKSPEQLDAYDEQKLIEDIQEYFGKPEECEQEQLTAIVRTEKEIEDGKELMPDEIAHNLEVIAQGSKNIKGEAKKALDILRRAFPFKT